MSEDKVRATVICILCIVVGLYLGYSLAYNDIILGCNNTGHVSTRMEIYSCVLISKHGV
jgi:hypothetical protein